MQKPFAITLDPGSSLANKTGTWRTERPVYVSRLPPCNAQCPAGEDIQGWLFHAESGDYEAAWHHLLVLKPHVEEISEDVHLRGIKCCLLQKAHDAFLPRNAACMVGHSEVEIGEEVDLGGSHWLTADHAEGAVEEGVAGHGGRAYGLSGTGAVCRRGWTRADGTARGAPNAPAPSGRSSA